MNPLITLGILIYLAVGLGLGFWTWNVLFATWPGIGYSFLYPISAVSNEGGARIPEVLRRWNPRLGKILFLAGMSFLWPIKICLVLFCWMIIGFCVCSLFLLVAVAWMGGKVTGRLMSK